MKRNRLFHDLYVNISTKRIILTAVLLVFVVGVLYYFNEVRKSLEDREEKYARLYAEGLGFFINQGVNNDCDYTFVDEVIKANETVPTILVTDGSPNIYLNIPELEDSTKKWDEKEKEKLLLEKVAEMAEEHKPLEFTVGKSKGYVYYANSTIVKQLSYFPYILIATFLVFGTLAYLTYSSSRKAEQNRVWVGLAKETAHQLGTPISGLMGWIEVLKINPDFDSSIGDEMLKDISRLETITNRFSNIGSEPTMKEENLGELIESAVEYLKKRISTKINWTLINNLEKPYIQKINKNLIEWVVENLCKNAVDAMGGIGNLEIKMNYNSSGKLTMDISDTGKGMNNAVQRKVFNPGFSTKKRGWGLGLTLAKRIIETYHGGQIYVLKSEIGKGTTFRIII
ncbi:PAS domain-containing sensor histidine kinase [Lacihabitans sp. CS3-21]|uniref:sensor histidine kinase n=1 Tax=Lacihabitans sp. CS3-21 TaxID=2487332 RepID=UPI0020CDBC81|nr:HAMP domain-containing sensor histidine kinase [Lacihabitans sp. CS3-21]MCP9746144.1 sensor histidine kinase [Lacihabitans sp. CS3-21]